MPNKDAKNRISRAPVVVVMGHIDHGKSTLLDFIRKTDIVAGEAGGITQHVGAYEAEHNSSDGKKHKITFLDTPGHEAFCSIRERGARAADIAILVVSAEDGVKPQTIEALKAIKAEKIPYVVAINKIDKPNADIDRTKQSLGENEIYVEGWGGDIPCVPISAANGTGIPELLDMVILVAEMADLKYDPKKTAEGIVIESNRDSRKGISATLLIKDGTLNAGEFVVTGSTFAPIRYIENYKGEKIDYAHATMPVCIVGWSEIPSCGDPFVATKSKKDAELMAFANAEKQKAEALNNLKIQKKSAIVSNTKSDNSKEKMGTIVESTDKSEIVSLPLVIKADANGSLEGVQHELNKIKHDRVNIKLVSYGIGPINENDVKTALSDPEIIIVGFNAEPDKKAFAMLERSSPKIVWNNFSIIYELAEYIKSALLAKVPKMFVEESTGRAKILAIFSKEKDRQVVGGKVETGFLASGNEVKILRREVEIGRGKIRELQEKKIKASEVREGHEFGVMIEAKTEIAVGDRVEAVRMIEKIQ